MAYLESLNFSKKSHQLLVIIRTKGSPIYNKNTIIFVCLFSVVSLLVCQVRRIFRCYEVSYSGKILTYVFAPFTLRITDRTPNHSCLSGETTYHSRLPASLIDVAIFQIIIHVMIHEYNSFGFCLCIHGMAAWSFRILHV